MVGLALGALAVIEAPGGGRLETAERRRPERLAEVKVAAPVEEVGARGPTGLPQCRGEASVRGERIR
jgi:hypothetical protein